MGPFESGLNSGEIRIQDVELNPGLNTGLNPDLIFFINLVRMFDWADLRDQSSH